MGTFPPNSAELAVTVPSVIKRAEEPAGALGRLAKADTAEVAEMICCHADFITFGDRYGSLTRG
jgi:hypothetical protein